MFSFTLACGKEGTCGSQEWSRAKGCDKRSRGGQERKINLRRKYRKIYSNPSDIETKTFCYIERQNILQQQWTNLQQEESHFVAGNGLVSPALSLWVLTPASAIWSGVQQQILVDFSSQLTLVGVCSVNSHNLCVSLKTFLLFGCISST